MSIPEQYGILTKAEDFLTTVAQTITQFSHPYTDRETNVNEEIKKEWEMIEVPIISSVTLGSSCSVNL